MQRREMAVPSAGAGSFRICTSSATLAAPRGSVLSILDWRDAHLAGRPFPFTPSVTDVYGLHACLEQYLREFPMGTPLRQIVEEMGGGAPDGGTIKAVQTGGPSGGGIPAEHLDTPVDYESLQALGSIMGSGGMIVIHDAHINADKSGPLPVAAYSALLMTITEGKCYSEKEMSECLSAAGFRNSAYQPTAADRSIITARK